MTGTARRFGAAPVYPGPVAAARWVAPRTGPLTDPVPGTNHGLCADEPGRGVKTLSWGRGPGRVARAGADDLVERGQVSVEGDPAGVGQVEPRAGPFAVVALGLPSAA